MLNINKTTENDTVRFSVAGRLDTITAVQFEQEVKSSLEGVKDLILDFAELEYVSSAGLRVLLSVQKIMNKQGSMKLVNVCSDVLEILEITGFTDILTIE